MVDCPEEGVALAAVRAAEVRAMRNAGHSWQQLIRQ